MDSRAVLESSRTEVEIAPELIRQELDRILKSRHFRHSKRSRQFLQFVVEQKIGGNEELVKERLIGVEVFGRNIDYATGDDPVVRVQAGEVRRRLELYQADLNEEQFVSIELPIGNYVPIFRHRSPGSVQEDIAAVDKTQDLDHRPVQAPEILIVAPGINSPEVYPAVNQHTPWRLRTRRTFWSTVAGACLCLVLAAIGIKLGLQHANGSDVMDAFWSPITATDKPVFICVGRPIVYQPSRTLFDSYAAKHPGAFATPLERRNRALPLDPQEMIRWGDLNVIYNSGPAIGGVRAAMNISALFGRRNIPFNTRFGNEASFAELRESPAVILGALNSRWMMQISSNLHFAMKETNNQLVIQEAGPNGRTWKNQEIAAGWRDYGIVTRQLKGPTGQFTVTVEGIGDGGTQGGSEIVSNPENLRNAIQSLPGDWAKKNIQLVVATDIIEGKPGPPQLIAFYVW